MNWNRTSRGLGVAVVLVFLVSVLTPAWNFLGAKLAVAPALRPCDAIVVLGAAVEPDGSLTGESLRRTVHGLRLLKNNLAALIVFSGPPRRDPPTAPEAQIRSQLAMEMGVTAESILQIAEVRSTREEAAKIAAMLRERNLRRILLVTESLHMRRAKQVFEQAGLEVFPAPSDNNAGIATSPEDRLALIRRILEECVALIYYRIVGYI